MSSTQDILAWSGVPRSSYYYKRGNGMRGRKPSEMTITSDGELVDNSIYLTSGSGQLMFPGSLFDLERSGRKSRQSTCVWTSNTSTYMERNVTLSC